MLYERDGLLLNERAEPQPDQELFDSLREITGGKETYSYLALSSERQTEVTENWRNGQEADLSLDGANVDEYLVKQASLRQWKLELLNNESIDPDTKQIYIWKVNEHIANINMLIASSNGDMRGFHGWNKFIYGEPDEVIYRASLDWVAHDAEILLADTAQPDSVHQASQKVIDLLEGRRGYREVLVPDSELYQEVRNDHMHERGYYGLLLAGINMPEGGKIDRHTGDPIVEQVLHNIGSDKPIKDADGATWSVDDEAVRRPVGYSLVLKRFIGLPIGHEVGSHELERTNGRRGPLALLAEGLDRYELGNEGRALIREQVPYETFDEFGKTVRWRDVLRRHIAVSFASGVGEDGPKTGLEVYNFMKTIDTMYQTKLKPLDDVAAEEAAHKKTGSLLTRVLKGTDGKGGAYLKDMVYLEGNVSGWLSAAERGPRAVSDGDTGKFDISNGRHLKELMRRGLLPESE